MPDYPEEIWQQLQNLTKKQFLNALKRDGWKQERGSSPPAYRHPDKDPIKNRIVIHYHKAKETMGKSLLKHQLALTEWTIDDLERLRLIDLN